MLGHAFNMQPASRQLCLILPFCLGTASSLGCIEVRIWGLLWPFRSILTALGTCRALCMPMPSISQEPGHLIPQLFLLSFLVSPLFADCYPLPKQLPLCVLNPSSPGKRLFTLDKLQIESNKDCLATGISGSYQTDVMDL